MKKAMKLFFIATLALMTAACSTKEKDLIPEEVPTTQQTQSADGITITAQLAPKSGNDATRALVEHSSYIEAKWAVDEHLAILYEVSGTKYAADARITEVDGSTGAATIEFTVEAGTADETPCTLVYPYSAANDEHSGLKALGALLGAQDGKILYSPNMDIRVGAGTIQTTTPGLSVEIQPEAQNAIFQFTIKDASNLENINVTKLTITTGAQDFVITPEGAKSTFFAALPALTEQAVSFVAKGSDGHTYYAANPEVTFTAGKYYKSTIKMTRHNTIDLSTLSASITAKDGDVLTGKLESNKRISIEDGATVRLNGVSINADGAFTTGNHAGIDCEGNATIILMDGTTNTVKGFYENYPGIYVPENKTLTIQGGGSLNASSNGAGCGIGGGYSGGSYFEIHCGNINIEGGIITATGGTQSAGIGGGKSGRCGNITISGGTIMATGGSYAVAIGGGESASCGNITITTDGILIASKGSGATNCIGAGNDGSSGTLSVYGATGAITDNTYTHNYNLGFTVNGGGTRVHFAPGNLQATTTDLGESWESWTWHFAEHQWDYIGNAAANNAIKTNDKLKVYQNGTVDLFSWSETIPSTADSYGIYSMINPPYDPYKDPYEFKDWGELSIGGDAPNTWRTLSYDEWEYLINGRPGARQKFALAAVHGVRGLLLLPDRWILPAGCSFIAGVGDWSRNVYTDAQWNLMEGYGAVFLPCAGMRMITLGSKSYVQDDGTIGRYWSSSQNIIDKIDKKDHWQCSFEFGYHVLDHGYHVKTNQFEVGILGFSVRLVK